MAEPRELTPETAHALRELAIAAIMRGACYTRERAEEAISSGEVSVHFSPDPEEYYRRWNRWYDSLSGEEQDAYHHEPCRKRHCLLCAIRDGLEEP